MAKRKASCGNARRCSMLLTNVTRSASYEALPNHRLFPAKFGLTSRFRLRNRCRWRRMKQQRRYCSAEEKAKSSLEAISCQQRATLEKRMQLRSKKSGDAVGRPSCRSSLLDDPGAKFLVETGHPNRTNEKLTKL